MSQPNFHKEYTIAPYETQCFEKLLLIHGVLTYNKVRMNLIKIFQARMGGKNMKNVDGLNANKNMMTMVSM